MSYKLEAKTRRKISPGRFYPLGADLQKNGVNFALYSENAKEVFLLLFDRPDADPTDIIRIDNCTRHIWHCFVEGLKPGQLYGYKVRGDYAPGQGIRFNENKLLLDPYAKALSGKLVNVDNLLLGYNPHSPRKDLEKDERDNTRLMPKSIVVDDAFEWWGDAHPEIPLEKMIIYEVHLKGFTAHPSSGAANRGTYLGFIGKIQHLKDLGVNAVEFLPVHEFHTEDFLKDRGLANYWGYNTAVFFAPELNYSTRIYPGCQVSEFKTLVRELHKAGVEVILDVVYNHSCEGSELGPTVCMRGIDNPTYYCLTGPAAEPLRFYENYSGCGNTLNLTHPAVIRLVLDSLRYWVLQMHVDGFRFDLASALGRDRGNFRKTCAFFDAIAQDPVLCRTKLIAEPWDISAYEVGQFPVDWSEWNGKFRDQMRKFGRGDPGQLRELGYRLTGSADLYRDDGRSPYNSVNFITCHDGFTLHDLLSYEKKQNQANLDNNRDGCDDNNSCNCGLEGETDDPAVLRQREQLAKNFFCYLLFSSGTPMIQGGDEFFRTQKGNNNAYCHDSELTWFNWELKEKNAALLEFCKKAIALTKSYPVLQRRKFLAGQDQDGNQIPDITWFAPDGNPPDWNDNSAKILCYQLDGSEVQSELGDYQLFFILNSDSYLHKVKLPRPLNGKRWRRVIDTSLPAGEDFLERGQEVLIEPADHYLANPRSTVALVASWQAAASNPGR